MTNIMLLPPKLQHLAVLTMLLSTGPGWAGTVSGNVADYNAAQVQQSNGVLVVPVGVATYTATSALLAGSSFKVTLPSGFTFGSAPSLTTSGSSTFALSSGGTGSQSATFTIAAADVTVGQTISLASFTVHGANALATVTPVANALPLTMQALGTDASPVPFKAFASDLGAAAAFVGAIQFINLSPPSYGTEFQNPPDPLTVVYSAIEISTQLTDSVTNSVPILGSNGLPNKLSSTDTAAVTMYGNTVGLTNVFSSSTSDCKHPTGQGFVGYGTLFVPNVPVGPEVFFCVTASGFSAIQQNPNGLQPVTVSPGTSTDFLTVNANVEFPGLTCYAIATIYGCATTVDLSIDPLLISFFFG